MKYAWIREHQKEFPVAILCDVLDVSCSGYYAWRHRKPGVVKSRTQQMVQAVTVSYLQSNRVYGYRKVYKDLCALSIAGCSETVRRVMKRLGFSAQIQRKYVVTTDSDHSFAVADNLLDRDFSATAPDQKWVADITYIPTQEGWLFLAAVLDLFGRRVVAGRCRNGLMKPWFHQLCRWPSNTAVRSLDCCTTATEAVNMLPMAIRTSWIKSGWYAV